jgi:hypothetical protein
LKKPEPGIVKIEGTDGQKVVGARASPQVVLKKVVLVGPLSRHQVKDE